MKQELCSACEIVEIIAVNQPSGLWLKTLEGYRAFRPHPLHSDHRMDASIGSQPLSRRSLAWALGAEGRRLPNPHVLIRPFVRREAVYSSRIEGTQATLGELLAAEAGATIKRSPDDLREVHTSSLGVRIEAVKDSSAFPTARAGIASQARDRSPGDHATRRIPPIAKLDRTAWICTLGRDSYVPPPPESLLEHLGRWEEFLHDESVPPLVHAAMMHYQFEAIHPF